MKKIITILSLTMTLQTIGFGQQTGTQLFYANWNFGPTINNPFVNSFSSWNGSIEYSYLIRKNLAAGAEIGWTNYYQYFPTATYHLNQGDATTDLYKYIYTIPVTATITEYFKIGHRLSPYAKIGLGLQYSAQNLYYNVFENSNNNLGFVVIPELGVKMRLNPYSHWSFKAGLQYTYGTNSASQYNLKNIQTLNGSLGLIWKMH